MGWQHYRLPLHKLCHNANPKEEASNGRNLPSFNSTVLMSANIYCELAMCQISCLMATLTMKYAHCHNFVNEKFLENE